MRQVGDRADGRTGRAAASAAARPSSWSTTRKRPGAKPKARLALGRDAAAGAVGQREAGDSRDRRDQRFLLARPGGEPARSSPGASLGQATPTPSAKSPCVPGRHTGASGESASTMHALPFRVEEMVADDLDRAEAAAQRVGDEGAAAVPRLAALDQRQRDMLARAPANSRRR